MNDPIPVGIIGMGGFAAAHHFAVRRLEEEGLCRLHCACDPNLDAFAAQQAEWNFAGRGVRMYRDYREMLAACGPELRMVSIPTPVPLHAEMHRACTERGIAVYLEKPPTVTYSELEAMIALDARAPRLTQVGFNYIVEPPRQAVKRRLLAGEFGAVRRVTFLGLWPRGDGYYGRASWAGRLLMDGRTVFDSPLSNAMAHHLHNALFWAGADALWSWAEVAEVGAELYRAHPIEGTDTEFARGLMRNGVELIAGVTHGCNGDSITEEVLECEQATIAYEKLPGAARLGFSIAWKDGRSEECPLEEGYHHTVENFRAYLKYVAGAVERPITRLADCRPFVIFNDLAYLAAGRINTIPETALDRSGWSDFYGNLLGIDGIESIMREFITTGRFPSAQGVSWAMPGGKAGPEELPRLHAVAEEMARGSVNSKPASC